MEKVTKEKKFDELIEKFKYFDDHLNNLADAMMYVVLVANTPDADGNCERPAWIEDVLSGLALARLELQEMYELRKDYTKLKDVPDPKTMVQGTTDIHSDSHQLLTEIKVANRCLGEVLDAICSRETIDDGATLDWMRKSIADARILLNRLANDSSTD